MTPEELKSKTDDEITALWEEDKIVYKKAMDLHKSHFYPRPRMFWMEHAKTLEEIVLQRSSALKQVSDVVAAGNVLNEEQLTSLSVLGELPRWYAPVFWTLIANAHKNPNADNNIKLMHPFIARPVVDAMKYFYGE